jgi:virginiamycin B lyase
VTTRTVEEYAVSGRDSGPYAITTGPDGALWFTMVPAAAPVGIAAGPDGSVWFTEIAAGQIGRRAPDGRITEYPLPDRSARPHAVTTDADGTAWFTEWGGNRVGSITSDGTVTVHDLPTPASEPHGITVGPDGALWTALETGALARIKPTSTRTTITTKHTEQRNAS